MGKPAAESNLPESQQPRAWRYRLVHLVYLMTLLAASIATFGAGGIFLAVGVGVFWGYVFTSPARPQAFLRALVVAIIGSCLISALLLPRVQTAREAARRMMCANQMKQIALALLNYHDEYGSFPPAYLVNERGEPQHSWRVLILPFLENQALYNAYDFGEPWNGPHNIRLLSAMPPIYGCPSTSSSLQGYTSYVAVVGPHTAWPGSSSRVDNEMTDGTGNTTLVLECNTQQIPWLAPQDLELNEALDLLTGNDATKTGNHRSEDFFHRYYHGRNMAMADGSVRYSGNCVDRETWQALLEVDDGASWDEDKLSATLASARQLQVGNCVRLGIFLLVVLLPLPWVWINPSNTVAKSA